MFNAQEFDAMQRRVRAEVLADKSNWRETLKTRYIEYLLRNAERNVSIARKNLADLGFGVSPTAGTFLEQSSMMAMIAGLLLGGDIELADPVKFEVIMRVNELAARPTVGGLPMKGAQLP